MTGRTNVEDNAYFEDEWPSWSPDGQRILFRRTTRGPDGDIGMKVLSLQDGSVRPFGSTARQSGLPELGAPAWAPNGQTAVFGARPDRSTDSGKGDLYVMSADGVVRRITRGAPYHADPVFTRDGRRILAERTEANGHVTLISLALDGSDPKPVFVTTSESALSIGNGRVFSHVEYALSPDGRTLALSANGLVYTTELRGGSLTRLRGQAPQFHTGGVAYSDEPDPRLIFTSGPQSLATPLESLSLDGRSIRRTILERPQAIWDQHPVWLPSTPRPVLDTTPPVLVLSGGGAGGTAARLRSRYPRISASAVRLQAFDSSGIRAVHPSLSRLVHTRRGMRCRFLGKRGFSPPRRCGRPRFTSSLSAAQLPARLARLDGGRYRLDVRAADVHGHRVVSRPLRFTLRGRKPASKKKG